MHTHSSVYINRNMCVSHTPYPMKNKTDCILSAIFDV